MEDVTQFDSMCFFVGEITNKKAREVALKKSAIN